jgi:hypothetical protein
MISLDTNLILAALDPLDALHERATYHTAFPELEVLP